MPPHSRQLLENALALHQRGQLAASIKQYDVVLALQPGNFDALHLKGLALYQTGALADALALLTKAIRQKDSFAPAHNNRGLVHQALGRRSEALKDFNRAIELNPAYAEAHGNRANVLREMGRLPEAAEACRRALALNPNIAEFHNSLGVIHKENRDWAAALAAFDTASKLKPNYVDAVVNIANVLKSLKRYDEAVLVYDRAIALQPGRAEIHANRGSAIKELERPEEALVSLDTAIALNPQSADLHSTRGEVLRELARLEEAVASCQTALALKPDHAPAWIVLARIQSETGHFEDARQSYEKARALDPRAVAALCGLAWIGKYASGDPIFAELEPLLADPSLSREDRAQLHHAYAKLCNDIGRHDDAMEQFAAGKRLLSGGFDIAQHRERYDALKQLFTPAFFAARTGHGVADERPVFIVGMPRSGTTLVEQVLASHGLVQGFGELPHMSRLARSIGGGLRDPASFGRAVAALGPQDVAALAARYQEAYRRAEPDRLRLVDKMPQNFQWLGLIALIFPKARIIHCRRDSLDTCVSIYMQNFIDRHDYGKDLTTLGGYFRAYDDLMAHWRQVLPVPIHDCTYEELVSDFEPTVRAMLSFLGLDWDPGCLDYHQSSRQVSTASLWQVRQPLFGSSVGRWRRYEKHLGPLREALGDRLVPSAS